MYIFWQLVLQQLLYLLRPKTIVEVGAEAGNTTQLLLGFCQMEGGVVHSIDPLPRFDVAAWKAKYGDCLVVHQKPSLEALPAIGACDLALIDGDHNWYTVFHELKLIEASSTKAGRVLPVMTFHDIGWPYGRRDLYYNPELIPAEFRQPSEKKSIRPGISELQEVGGINAHLWNAVSENTPRNGVLTAVEDFAKESSQELELTVIPGFHGLGVLVPVKWKSENQRLGDFLADLKLSPAMIGYVELLERNRVELLMELGQLREAYAKLEAQWRAFLMQANSPLSFKATVAY